MRDRAINPLKKIGALKKMEIIEASEFRQHVNFILYLTFEGGERVPRLFSALGLGQFERSWIFKNRIEGTTFSDRH